jgi:Fe-S cluster biosynthesis and repair protein YggX
MSSLGKEAGEQYFHHQHPENTDDKILLVYLNEQILKEVEKVVAARKVLEMAMVEYLHAYGHSHIEGWMESDGCRQESTDLRELEWELEE